MKSTNTLWYRKPALNWNESLPLGNGRLGANVFGGVKSELYTLNDDTLWGGYPRYSQKEGMPEVYNRIRELVLAERFKEAENLSEAEFSDFLNQNYMPFGNLTLDMCHEAEATDYKRELSLSKAVHTVKYSAGGTEYLRESFISPGCQTLCVRLTADHPERIGFLLDLTCKLKSQRQILDNGIVITGNCPIRDTPLGCSDVQNEEYRVYSENDAEKGMGFCGAVLVKISGGSLISGSEGIRVQNADEAQIYFALRTSFNGFDKHPVLDGAEYLNRCTEEVNKAAVREYVDLLREHIAMHRELYNRMSLHLECECSDAPTDERLTALQTGAKDNHLYVLLFNYARYLMICGSREGTQPMNLQGIWNDSLNPPWSANYTMNINTQMNYWPALQFNLTECIHPLLNMISDLAQNGRDTARRFYGVNGAVCHTATDIWNFTHPHGGLIPGNCGWNFWNLSGGWLCSFLYEYWLFTGDKKFLRDKALPLMEEFALFYSELLIPDKNGRLIFCPSTSPENLYCYDTESGEEETPLAATAAMSMAIIRELFKNIIKAGDILDVKNPVYEKIKVQLPKLKPYEITPEGRILEWSDINCRESDPFHRHLSHLYGLFPGREITPERTPELARACEKSLKLRGDHSTGWSLAWKINLWARLGRGDKALELLKNQLTPVDSNIISQNLRGGTYPNMLCAHPFQIDGNFGVASGIMQMLLQYGENGEMKLLPALPQEWDKGSVIGMCIPGGTIDFEWENGEIKNCKILPSNKD